jgi:hypothetical protein
LCSRISPQPLLFLCWLAFQWQQVEEGGVCNWRSEIYRVSEPTMGLLSTVMGVVGFGWGISLGLVVGYFVFIYLRSTDVKARCSLSLSRSLISASSAYRKLWLQRGNRWVGLSFF